MKNISAYTTESNHTNEKLQYLFESRGKKLIIKAIEYQFIKSISGRRIFNLGFGDYDNKNDSIFDDVTTDNGDMRRVFSTVLDTIPRFFDRFRDAGIFVQGSDSSENYRKLCNLSCTKNCIDFCKNRNRRIRIYRYYVDKNFVQLCEEYVFFGLTANPSNIVQYIPNSEYIGILVFRKK